METIIGSRRAGKSTMLIRKALNAPTDLVYYVVPNQRYARIYCRYLVGGGFGLREGAYTLRNGDQKIIFVGAEDAIEGRAIRGNKKASIYIDDLLWVISSIFPWPVQAVALTPENEIRLPDNPNIPNPEEI